MCSTLTLVCVSFFLTYYSSGKTLTMNCTLCYYRRFHVLVYFLFIRLEFRFSTDSFIVCQSLCSLQRCYWYYNYNVLSFKDRASSKFEFMSHMKVNTYM